MLAPSHASSGLDASDLRLEEEEEEEEEEEASSMRSSCLCSCRSHLEIWILFSEPLFWHFVSASCLRRSCPLLGSTVVASVPCVFALSEEYKRTYSCWGAGFRIIFPCSACLVRHWVLLMLHLRRLLQNFTLFLRVCFAGAQFALGNWTLFPVQLVSDSHLFGVLVLTEVYTKY